jgi:lipopolysaccharide transport system permease protein
MPETGTLPVDSVADRQDSAHTLCHDQTSDILVGVRSWRIWGTLGWHDIRQRYRRSVLGPFWFTLSTAIKVVALGVLYATLFKVDIRDYLPYLAVGLVIWQYMEGAMNEGCEAFTNAAALVKQIRLPLTIHVCRAVWRNFIILLHSLPVAILLLLVFGHWPGARFALVFPGLFLLLLHGVWIGVILGILCARFRDIPPIVASLVQIAFFLTPVMWMPEILRDRAWVAQYNPFYHTMEIVRAPILNRPLHWHSWVWTLCLLVIGFLAAQYLMRRARNRVPYWL